MASVGKRFFRHNGGRGAEAAAEAKAVQARQDVFDRAKDKAVHLLHALKSWPGYDATGNIEGAMAHTDATIDALDEVLDELRDEMDKFRGIKRVEIRAIVPGSYGHLGPLRSAAQAEATAVDEAAKVKQPLMVTPADIALLATSMQRNFPKPVRFADSSGKKAKK